MCGIAGAVRQDGAIMPDPSAALVAALAHRGPDGHGVWRSPAEDALLSMHRRTGVTEYAIFAVTIGVQQRSGPVSGETRFSSSD